MKYLKPQIEDRRVSLEYLKSIQAEEIFDTTQPLFHLAHLSQISKILSTGLKPSMPEPTIHSRVLKGEKFKGIWLSSYKDPWDIVDIHSLPQELAYEGRVLKIDNTKLNPEMFTIGIEFTPKLLRQIKSGFKISPNEYFEQTSEIIYLENIPPEAIELLD